MKAMGEVPEEEGGEGGEKNGRKKERRGRG